MTNEELQQRIERSPRLRKLQAKLLEEVTFRADTSVQLDPITIVMIISIVVQIIIHCRENRSDEEIIADIRDIRVLPPRRLVRLRRRLNALWRNCCEQERRISADVNPILTSVYEIGENSDDATIKELIELARDTRGNHGEKNN